TRVLILPRWSMAQGGRSCPGIAAFQRGKSGVAIARDMRDDPRATAPWSTAMDFRDRHSVITGGTGALGTAVVEALVGAGAVCHVPFIGAAEAERFALRSHAQVRLTASQNLADEAAVAKLYDGVPQLW